MLVTQLHTIDQIKSFSNSLRRLIGASHMIIIIIIIIAAYNVYIV